MLAGNALLRREVARRSAQAVAPSAGVHAGVLPALCGALLLAPPQTPGPTQNHLGARVRVVALLQALLQVMVAGRSVSCWA